MFGLVSQHFGAVWLPAAACHCPVALATACGGRFFRHTEVTVVRRRGIWRGEVCRPAKQPLCLGATPPDHGSTRGIPSYQNFRFFLEIKVYPTSTINTHSQILTIFPTQQLIKIIKKEKNTQQNKIK